MVCQYKFHGNPQNYVSDRDHDENTRKMWFIVFGEGLFTKKTDAVAYALKNDVVNDDSVHIFNTKAQALRCWARHCRRRHANGCHNSADASEYESDADSDTDHDTEAPALPSDGSRRQRKCEGSAKPIVKREPAVLVKGEPVVKAETLSVKREGKPVMMGPPTISSRRSASVRPKRAQSGSAQTAPAPARVPSPKLPLYVDDTDDDLFASDSEVSVPLAASRANTRALSTLTEDNDVPMAAPPPPVSPTMSSVSSLTATSLASSGFSAASHSTCAPPFAPASSASRAGSRVPGPSGAPPPLAASASTSSGMRPLYMLFNRRTRVLYGDPEVGVEEMQPGNSMQVVEPGDVASWMGSMSG
ncbi:hypothetical protein K438DRAFT_1975139 [Mycena galopus ATCC 62051]|nr:hypothetical protein K438DRAFT_1975139 [Mycena galopus ATCC 62051]